MTADERLSNFISTCCVVRLTASAEEWGDGDTKPFQNSTK